MKKGQKLHEFLTKHFARSFHQALNFLFQKIALRTKKYLEIKSFLYFTRFLCLFHLHISGGKKLTNFFFCPIYEITYSGSIGKIIIGV